MNYDLFILFNSFLSFAVFLFLQLVVFRLIDQMRVLNWIIRIYFIGLLLNITLLAIFGGLYSFESIFFSAADYTLVSLVYILWIFGMMESSLRVRILLEIAKAKREGISQVKLLKIYNKDKIISKRLERLKQSGDLKFDGKYYSLGRKLSYFSLHNFLLGILKNFYLK